MNDKQKYMVFNHKDEHEYNILKEITDDGEKITLFRSNSSTWTDHSKGEKIMSLIDDGNAIKFDRKFKSLEYHELFELRLLLNFQNQTDDNPHNREKYRVIENKTLFEA